jgi:hypothetical protein
VKYTWCQNNGLQVIGVVDRDAEVILDINIREHANTSMKCLTVYSASMASSCQPALLSGSNLINTIAASESSNGDHTSMTVEADVELIDMEKSQMTGAIEEGRRQIPEAHRYQDCNQWVMATNESMRAGRCSCTAYNTSRKVISHVKRTSSTFKRTT